MKSFTKDAKTSPISLLTPDLAIHAAGYLDGGSMAALSRTARFFKPVATLATKDRLATLLLQYENAIPHYSAKHAILKKYSAENLIKDAKAKMQVLENAETLFAKIIAAHAMRNKVIDPGFERRVLLPALKSFEGGFLAEFNDGNLTLKAKRLAEVTERLRPYLYTEIAPTLLRFMDGLFASFLKAEKEYVANPHNDSKAQKMDISKIAKAYEALKTDYQRYAEQMSEISFGIL